MRFLSLISISGLLVFFFSGCEKNTNNNPVPVISFKSFTVSQTADSATLQINFTDGDGDIGYPAQDPTAPYNFFIQYWYSTDTLSTSLAQFPDTAIFKPYININQNPPDTLLYSYHIPDITQPGKNKSLTGIIQIIVSGTPPLGWFVNYASAPYRNFFQYKVWIYDRAGHKSNVITTPIEQGL
jgi:hypothetical protein